MTASRSCGGVQASFSPPQDFFCAHKLFGDCGDHLVLAFEARFELLNLPIRSLAPLRASRTLKSGGPTLEEGVARFSWKGKAGGLSRYRSALPPVEECRMNLVFVADLRDRLPFHKVELVQSNFILAGILPACAWCLVVVHWSGFLCPTLAYLIRSIRTFRLVRDTILEQA